MTQTLLSYAGEIVLLVAFAVACAAVVFGVHRVLETWEHPDATLKRNRDGLERERAER